MAMNQTVAEAIASACSAHANCKPDNPWRARWAARVKELASECLPSGSGFDTKPVVDVGRSGLSRIVVTGSYHRMDEYGYYAGWRDYTVTVRPSFIGLDVRVSGLGVELNENAADTFRLALEAAAPEIVVAEG